ncbi:SDR family oxidoreductase [Nostoc sp. NMS4]|uniref:SDR family NAD(P)-dependent oxidoreductase n=1 Tax=Nostoc sp. NMS4 TaxID=2815390 RepID=UPI0025F7B2BA|nr:SDR family oxidoreductase [Nostoc sp. NMS4]MBN3922578.1 SDR family oxidoreductase [Nostoc sp. NMS4]
MNLPTSRTVIITGGNSGIGRGIAEAFARENTQVVIMGRNEETLRTTIEHLGPKAFCKQVDITQSAQVADAVTAVVQQLGQIDVLVNAAGLPRWITTETPLDQAEQLWDEVVNTNLKGSFLMAMAVAPYLTRPGGRIINISTNAAFTGGSCPGYLGYAAAKAGVHGLTYALARELSPQGITVNAIAPGLIANTAITNMWSEERLQSIVAETPVGRAGCVDDVAAAVLYLASKEASFITGEVLNINGGLVFGH